MKNISIPSRSTAGLLILSLIVLSFGFAFTNTASAWSTGICSSTNFYGAAPDQVLLASNGDVVTTNKWNAFVCNFVILGELIYGSSNTDRKQSVFDFHTNASNTLGSSVSAVRLPTIIAGSPNPNVGGMLAFYQPTGSYGASTIKSGVASYSDSGQSGLGIFTTSANSTMHIFTKINPTRDVGASPDVLHSVTDLRRHALAWEGVSTTDSANFDTKCQYRIVAGPGEGWVLYMSAVATGMIRGQFNSDVSGSQNSDVSILVNSNAKNTYKVYNATGLVPASIGVYGNGTVTHLEKLCLPVYNP